MSGAIISALIQKILGIRTLLVAAFLLSIINTFYGYVIFLRHKEWEKELKSRG